MNRGHKQYFVTVYETRTHAHNGATYGRVATIGNASTLKSAKAMITRYRRENQQYSPQNFNVFDCWADTDPNSGFAPVVYHED